jgi:hypothetical protein
MTPCSLILWPKLQSPKCPPEARSSSSVWLRAPKPSSHPRGFLLRKKKRPPRNTDELILSPDRAHNSVGSMGIRSKQQVSDFV